MLAHLFLPYQVKVELVWVLRWSLYGEHTTHSTSLYIYCTPTRATKCLLLVKRTHPKCRDQGLVTLTSLNILNMLSLQAVAIIPEHFDLQHKVKQPISVQCVYVLPTDIVDISMVVSRQSTHTLPHTLTCNTYNNHS